MHLSENPTDFAGAFHRLPQKLLSLFVQAQQSFLFNDSLANESPRGLPLMCFGGDFVVGVERNGLPMANTAEIVTEERLSKVNEAMAAGRMRVALPMFDAKGKLSGGVMGEIEQCVLDEEGVEVKSLLTSFPTWAVKVACERNNPVKDFKVEVFEGKAAFEFYVASGLLRDVVLREIYEAAKSYIGGLLKVTRFFF